MNRFTGKRLTSQHRYAASEPCPLSGKTIIDVIAQMTGAVPLASLSQ